jgi:acetyltransferase-like isoleucine patch superfamily enzyme
MRLTYIIQKAFYFLFKYPVYKMLFGKIGAGTRLINPMINGHKRIFLGSHVYIRNQTWLAADPVTGDTNCRLTIGDGTYVGNFCHFYATSKIEIGKKVLFADKVYLSDNLHSYKNIELPVMDQPVQQVNAVLIGDGAWIGENVCIIGASVGKNSVVGANAVVTKNIPDYCVAVGAPAIIIKRYDFELKEWRSTDATGNFK